MSTEVGTWTNWLTFEPDPDHSPDAGTRLLTPISYRLRNFATLPSLAYFSANLAYLSAFSVSICANLAHSILTRDRNTATEPNFQKSLSKCGVLSPKNSYLSISHVNQQQHCSSAARLDPSITSVRPMTTRSIFSLSVFTVLISSSLFLDTNGSLRCKCVPKYIDTDNRRRSRQKNCCAFLIFMLVSVIYLRDTAKTALL